MAKPKGMSWHTYFKLNEYILERETFISDCEKYKPYQYGKMIKFAKQQISNFRNQLNGEPIIFIPKITTNDKT